MLASVGDGRMLEPRRCSATASLRGVAGVTKHAGMGEDAMADDVAELVVLGDAAGLQGPHEERRLFPFTVILVTWSRTVQV